MRSVLAFSILATALVACGGTAGSGSSALVDAGADLASSEGCVACHGADGEGGIGPAWVGLAGSTVELDDGTTVTADGDYLRTSITDPTAQVVAGYEIQMPENDLGDTEVEALVAYIESLG